MNIRTALRGKGTGAWPRRTSPRCSRRGGRGWSRAGTAPPRSPPTPAAPPAGRRTKQRWPPRRRRPGAGTDRGVMGGGGRKSAMAPTASRGLFSGGKMDRGKNIKKANKQLIFFVNLCIGCKKGIQIEDKVEDSGRPSKNRKQRKGTACRSGLFLNLPSFPKF